MSIFERLLEATEKTGDVMLRYAFQKDMIKQSILEQREKEKLKKEIADYVLSQVNIRLEKEAIEKLKAMISSLGRGV